MTVFVVNIVLIYLLDAVLVGTSFFVIKRRFRWNLSPGLTFATLVLLMAIFENLVVPAYVVLDLTFTIRNPEISSFFEFKQNEPAINLFSLGFIDFLIWCVQAFIASLIGEKLVPTIRK